MATVRDISAATGLSTATVSRALRGQACVSKETRQTVMEAAKKLGHPSCHIHRGDSIVVLSSPYEKQITPMMIAVQGMIETGRASGYKIFDYTITDEDTLSDIADMVNEGIFAGIIIPELPSNLLEKVMQIEDKSRIVQCCGKNDLLRSPCVLTDDAAAARKAVEYLITLGHVRIGVLAHSEKRAFSRTRLDAYVKAMTAHGLRISDSWIHYVNSTRYDFAYQIAVSALKAPDRPTAFFAFTDYYALALVNAAHDLKIRIPEDLSVIGFDDLELAHIKTPSITTFRQPFEQLGNIACSLLINSITGDRPSRTEYLIDADLVIRETTGPAPEQQVSPVS